MRSIIAIALVLLVGCSRGSSGGGGGNEPTPSGTPAKFAYVLNTGAESISSFAINADGSLTALSTALATGNFPKAMVMDKSLNVIYVANLGGTTISQYKINTDGTLAALGDVFVGQFPDTMVISPDHKHLYSISVAENEISQFAIGSDGTLSLVSKISHTDGPVNMTFSPSGQYAYVVNVSTTDISQYQVHSDGTLAALSPASVPSLGCPSGPVTAKTATDGSENIYALSCATNEVEVFKVGQGGQLSTAQIIATGDYPIAMSVEGETIYVTNFGDNTVTNYKILNDGKLQAAATTPVPGLFQMEAIAVDRAGKLAFLVDAGNDTVVPFDLNSADELVPSATAATTTDSFPTKILLK